MRMTYTFKNLWPLMRDERFNLVRAGVAIAINSLCNLAGPIVVGHALDTYIQNRDYSGVLRSTGLLVVVYLIALVSSYLQTRWMGGVGQRVLFTVRTTLFGKLQSLPVSFFNKHQSGDLISRLNNDTDKLNQFFSQALMQFIGNAFIMLGAAIFLVVLNPALGLATLVPAALLLIFNRSVSAWVKNKNANSLKSTGGLSAEIQESLDNFKVIVAFNRRDYFRSKFSEANEANYKAAVGAGIANNIFTPVYGLSSALAQLIVLVYGIYLITHGSFTVGLLVSFLAYATNFYNPLRHLAALWANFQVAVAGWDRIAAILAVESDLVTVPEKDTAPITNAPLLEFKDVHFAYPNGKVILHDINLQLEAGKTYALVGPTGGGKTTTASLMARLYDPTQGSINLHGHDLRSYSPEDRAQKIGFILQEPMLFSGTIRDNIKYGHAEYADYTNQQLLEVLKKAGLDRLMTRFDQGLDTPVAHSGDSISLGQKQIIAFMRAVLRQPELLILDEATANIDTVTEQILEEILAKLPTSTTRVIIAHRLNTIANADEIFFVNSGAVTPAGSMEHAVEMLLHHKRQS